MNRITKWLSLGVLVVLVMSLAPAVSPAEACCCCDGPGTGTPGYWKNHPEAWPESITIGGVTYSKDEALDWLNSPVKGDKTITMFKALVAAKLNVWAGNCSDCIAGTIADADKWLAAYPVGSGVHGNSAAWRCGEKYYWMLDKYNNGYLCAPPR
jgi:hypothetical protein